MKSSKLNNFFITLLVAVFVICGLTGLTLAFYSTSKTLTGEIKLGELDFTVYSINSINGFVMPGETVEAGIGIVNARDKNGQNTNNLVDILLRISPVQSDGIVQSFNTKNFTYDGNYYYYNDVLKVGEKTDFFDSFTLFGNLSNDFQGDNITLTFEVEALQSENEAYLSEWADAPKVWQDKIAERL